MWFRRSHTVNFRLNMLGPGFSLGAHRENLLIRTRAGGVGARLRLHLLIITNLAAELTLDGKVDRLEADVI